MLYLQLLIVHIFLTNTQTHIVSSRHDEHSYDSLVAINDKVASKLLSEISSNDYKETFLTTYLSLLMTFD